MTAKNPPGNGSKEASVGVCCHLQIETDESLVNFLVTSTFHAQWACSVRSRASVKDSAQDTEKYICLCGVPNRLYHDCIQEKE